MEVRAEKQDQVAMNELESFIKNVSDCRVSDVALVLPHRVAVRSQH